MNQEWFEMLDIRKRNFNKSVWIPLRATNEFGREGEYGYDGYKEESFYCGSIAIPSKDIALTEKLEWTDVGALDHCAYWEDGNYIPAETHKLSGESVVGLRLVIDQISHDESFSIWHLNQDFVVALGLIREGNSWVCPSDGYAVVARLKVNAEGNPLLLEVKSQYLKDYLCAREMGLYMTTIYTRKAVAKDISFITWTDRRSAFEDESDDWFGGVMPIHEGGDIFIEKLAFFNTERTDVDETDDALDIYDAPADENTQSELCEGKFEGEELYQIVGELRRNEIIEPGKASPKAESRWRLLREVD